MIARLHIQTGVRDNKTYLKNCFASPPFKVANITEDKREKALHLMLMTSSPGILDGDEYKLDIEVDEGANLHLHTQSYQRLFSMKSGASQKMTVRMKTNSSFHYLPHPCVPHAMSDFFAGNKIYLSAGCKLIWGEVITCGRKLHGEAFQFSRYQNLTEIFLHGRLIIKENLLLQPADVDVNAIGQFEGYTHQASLIYLNETSNSREEVAAVHELLLGQQDNCFGVSALPVKGIIVRILGYKGEQLHTLLKTVSAFLNKRNEAVVCSNKSEKISEYAS